MGRPAECGIESVHLWGSDIQVMRWAGSLFFSVQAATAGRLATHAQHIWDPRQRHVLTVSNKSALMLDSSGEVVMGTHFMVSLLPPAWTMEMIFVFLHTGLGFILVQVLRGP